MLQRKRQLVLYRVARQIQLLRNLGNALVLEPAQPEDMLAAGG